ncbi:L-threonylcarbamoyladenylate synthase [Pelodictyon luteolum]|uniref:Threonylcarbamoyl-AMP synthase n=1 Tax=Chlorobium luteolum (strain DSM 273 / BCRC 81028 / 2530) TaxID=319225 RepID=Q3B291_CHLL3|nr:L-threonylcarbamoyladenylate synthase [Pelodictyon luteolum]ABB24540.1 translation factor SUA5 [Pelodictyon luteolum DSM 273]
MQTCITDSAEEAARILNAGKIVAFPTETVYGLGAGIDFPEAVEGLFRAKGRPSDNPLIVHVSSVEQVEMAAARVTTDARRLMERFFPGPLTIVFPKSPRVPHSVTAGLETVGIRCPRHPVAREFLSRCCCPVAAPSANRSGRPSATTWQAVQEDLDGRIDAILKGEASRIGLESTIVDCTGPHPVMLRAGAVSLEELQSIVPSTTAARPLREGETPKSPGLKYPHYAPEATIIPIEKEETPSPEGRAAYIGTAPAPKGMAFVEQCPDLEAYARSLFHFFRECDRRAISTIYCELPPTAGIGRALLDRINRAAGRP